MKAVIIGAGIGGLTTAIALAQIGLDVELFEAADQISEVGAGILLGTNAMLVLRELGVHQKVQAAGITVLHSQITDQNLKALSQIPNADLEKEYGVGTVAIHRARLIEVLRNKIQQINCHTNKRATDVIQSETEVKVAFEDGTFATGDIVIAADGINSAIRKRLFPARKARTAGQMCWRGLVDMRLPDEFRRRITEAWGLKARVGFLEIASGLVYWFAVVKKSSAFSLKRGDAKVLEGLFSAFPAPIPEIFACTKPERIIKNEILDLRPARPWSRGNICLIGDAAHATTPNMGQGGAQAIEDALALARSLQKYRDPQIAFRHFEQLRFEKTRFIIKQSRRIGQLAHWDNQWLVSLRNFMMRSAPQKYMKKQFQQLYQINY